MDDSQDGGADVSAPPAHIELFHAVEKGDRARVRECIETGADPDAKRADGITPLILACSRGDAGTVEVLLELGADPALPSDEGWTPVDFARGRGDGEIEDLLLHPAHPAVPADEEKLVASHIIRDLYRFIDVCNLKIPKAPYRRFLERVEEDVGADEARRIDEHLQRTRHRVLMEQLFAPEAFNVARFSRDFRRVRSPMSLGAHDLASMLRRGIDPVAAAAGNYDEAADLLSSLLPDNLFSVRPRTICEVGGAWGATIKYLTERFAPAAYYNFEPDTDYARFTQERFGAIAMPTDGETLDGIEDASIDLAISNNVFIFLPVVKVWSYLMEFRRVVRPGGVIVFNCILSDQCDEERMRKYLVDYFPLRNMGIVPHDLVGRTFPADAFEIDPVFDGEYLIIRRRG